MVRLIVGLSIISLLFYAFPTIFSYLLGFILFLTLSIFLVLKYYFRFTKEHLRVVRLLPSVFKTLDDKADENALSKKKKRKKNYFFIHLIKFILII